MSRIMSIQRSKCGHVLLLLFYFYKNHVVNLRIRNANQSLAFMLMHNVLQSDKTQS
jgi:hypothetical protein